MVETKSRGTERIINRERGVELLLEGNLWGSRQWLPHFFRKR